MQVALDIQNDQLRENSKSIDVAIKHLQSANEYQSSTRHRLDRLRSRLHNLETQRADLEARLAALRPR